MAVSLLLYTDPEVLYDFISPACKPQSGYVHDVAKMQGFILVLQENP
jgi:hypothetical protein